VRSWWRWIYRSTLSKPTLNNGLGKQSLFGNDFDLVGELQNDLSDMRNDFFGSTNVGTMLRETGKINGPGCERSRWFRVVKA
jgi:hypothetical protein